MHQLLSGLLTIALFPIILITTLIVSIVELIAGKGGNESILLEPTTTRLSAINTDLASALQALEVESRINLANFIKENEDALKSSNK